MNNMLMQRIVDEVVFRLKQRAGKTLVLTVFQLRDASVQEIVHQYAHYKSDMSICRCYDNLRGTKRQIEQQFRYTKR